MTWDATGSGVTRLLAIVLIAALATSTYAGSYHNEATVYGSAMTHDDQFGHSVVWFGFDDEFGTPQHATGVMLNPWYGITSAHLFSRAGAVTSNHHVGTGDNYLSNPGDTFQLDDFGIHPGWSGNFSGGFMGEIDLAWFKLDAPISGAGVDLGVAELGDVLTVPEFGVPATPSGYLPVDGERRAFDAVVDGFGQPGAFSSDYLTSDFYPPFIRNLPLGGTGTNGTSGSPWFNLEGSVVGIHFGASGTPYHGSISGAVDLAPHRDWIIANTTVPEPATLSLVLLGGMAVLQRRIRRRFA